MALQYHTQSRFQKLGDNGLGILNSSIRFKEKLGLLTHLPMPIFPVFFLFSSYNLPNERNLPDYLSAMHMNDLLEVMPQASLQYNKD